MALIGIWWRIPFFQSLMRLLLNSRFSFVPMLLHAINAFGNDSQKILDYALAAATLKYSIAGDYNLATDEEIQTLMKG